MEVRRVYLTQVIANGKCRECGGQEKRKSKEPLVVSLPSYIRDTTSALQRLDQIYLEENMVIVTADVESLYTSIRHQDGLKSTAMGASCAPSYANLFLGAWDREIFHNDDIQLMNHVHNWMRYIDDVLFFWDGPRENLEDLMSHLNNNDQNILLTFKSGKQIDFLDIKLTVDSDGRLNTDVFRKATATNSFLVADSSHPPATIRGIPVGQFLRAKRICSNESNFEKQAIDLTRRFTERGYSKKMIRKGYQRASGISRDRLLYGPFNVKKLDQQHPIRFISTYSNQWNQLKEIIRKHWQVLKVDPVLCKILPELPSFVPKRSANLKDILVQSHYDPKNVGTKSSSGVPGFFPCGLCKGCLNHVKSKTFCNHDGSRSFNIWKHLSCNSQGVIYHAQCPCGKVYVGLTTRELKCSLFLLSYGIFPYGVLKKLGVPGPRPLPFIGTFLEYRKGVVQFDMECFNKYGKLWGLYDGRQPVIAVLDPAIIKTVLVKECYTNFTNRRNLGPKGPMDSAITIAADEQWKRTRTVLSPTFTSGKLKEMFQIMNHYSNTLVRNIQAYVDKDESCAIKDVLGAYSMDVVTSSSFSVNIDSLNNPNDPFVTKTKKLLKLGLFSPVLILVVLFPFLRPILDGLKVNFFPKDILNFYMNAVTSFKEKRMKGDSSGRVDFLQLMLDSRVEDASGLNKEQKALTDSEILAQSVIFILAGFETTSMTLTYLFYNLATHPDVQKKLQEEVDSYLPDKASSTYDILMQMEFLDMVIQETLPMYPPAGRLEKVSKQTVEINGVTIPKGAVCMIPAYVLHYVPEFWPEPEEFRPER
ncbi:cytochrome P450 3A2-like [Ranitomeya imitator]|uniref:cytochrome P450 3A2-like n=1 Tax=Ranitomeya imitator TaxID=111125 RepID=UPI0037E80AB1